MLLKFWLWRHRNHKISRWQLKLKNGYIHGYVCADDRKAVVIATPQAK